MGVTEGERPRITCQIATAPIDAPPGTAPQNTPRIFRGSARDQGAAYDVFAGVLRARFGILEGVLTDRLRIIGFGAEVRVNDILTAAEAGAEDDAPLVTGR